MAALHAYAAPCCRAQARPSHYAHMLTVSRPTQRRVPSATTPRRSSCSCRFAPPTSRVSARGSPAAFYANFGADWSSCAVTTFYRCTARTCGNQVRPARPQKPVSVLTPFAVERRLSELASRPVSAGMPLRRASRASGLPQRDIIVSRHPPSGTVAHEPRASIPRTAAAFIACHCPSCIHRHRLIVCFALGRAQQPLATRSAATGHVHMGRLCGL